MRSIPPSGIASRGVDRKIENAVLELVLVAKRRPQVGGQRQLELDLFAHRAAKQVLHGGDKAVDPQRLGVQRLPTRKGQQPVGQRRRTVGGRHGAVDVALDLAQASVGQTLLREIERPDDALQQVVEIVGDAAGELADGFHLLRLAQRLLGAPQSLGCLLLVGHVARGGIDQLLVRRRRP
jgi:hypothetical protein